MSKRLYVGNLAYEVTEDELSRLFTQCGTVTGATIMKDPSSGDSKGFGFVEMADDEEGTLAIKRMTGFDLHGRPLRVDAAKGKPRSKSRR